MFHSNLIFLPLSKKRARDTIFTYLICAKKVANGKQGIPDFNFHLTDHRFKAYAENAVFLIYKLTIGSLH